LRTKTTREMRTEQTSYGMVGWWIKCFSCYGTFACAKSMWWAPSPGRHVQLVIKEKSIKFPNQFNAIYLNLLGFIDIKFMNLLAYTVFLHH